MVVQILEVEKLVRHPEHKKMFGSPTEKGKDLTSLKEAYERNKKFVPILYVVVLEGKIEKFYVINGWSSVIIYREKGFKTIPGIKVDLEKPDKLPYILADLHTTYHKSAFEDFQKFSYFRDLLGLGKGYRSDIDNEDKDN